MVTKVLVIEDDREMGRLLQLELQQEGFDISIAVNGLDGLRMFHELRPNLVLLDIALPQMDGLTVCQRIRELSNVPILILTANAISEEDIARRKAETPLPALRNDSPWQELYRAHVGQLESGAVLEFAVKYRDLRKTVPRHSH